jgi:mono/diheme cytochrome c family protein
VSAITNGTTTGMPSFSSTHSAAQIDAIAGYILSLAPSATTTTTTVPGSPPPPPPSGATVFARKCAACHGASGGNLVGRSLTTSQISAVVNNGTTGMPGFVTSLSKAETDAVVAYVAGKAAGGSATTTTTGPGSTPPSGATVFASKCAACHGASGGDLVGHSLSDAELASVITRGAGSMPAFASQLNAREIDAVVTYLSALGSNATTAAVETGDVDAASLYVRYCSACHGAHGEGGLFDAVAGTSLSRSDLIAVITRGRGSMPDYSGRMTADEIEAVAGFVLALGSSEDGASIASDDGSAGLGGAAPNDDGRTPSLIRDIQADAGGGLPVGVLVVAVLGVLGLVSGAGYVRIRASRGLAR